ncbi:MAG: hypothetical protein KF799_15020 [Bdellovibrionales bacterium]|nr:hypothetical protein [Bdellovibrionales bacterium]
MKSVAKVAVCGILALAINANAQVGQAISQDALQIINKNAAARQYLAEKLGVRAGSASEANVALKKLAPADQAAVLKAITAYTKNAVDSSSAAASASNTAAAKAAFASNTGSVIESVVNAQNAKKNETISCSQKLDASRLAVAGGPSVATIEAANKAGVVARGGCAENPEEMSQENIKVFGLLSECGLNKGLNVNSSEAERVEVMGACLATINNISVEEAKTRVASINNKCGWFSAKYAQSAAAAAR